MSAAVFLIALVLIAGWAGICAGGERALGDWLEDES